MKANPPIHVSLSGNFNPEWRQLIDAVGNIDDIDYSNDANIADAAREFVQAVLEMGSHSDISENGGFPPYTAIEDLKGPRP